MEELTNLNAFCLWTQGVTEKEFCEKYNLTAHQVEWMIKYGREECYNTIYWKEYLKPLLKTT
jgi:hypothetical protein